ncbi:MAG: magnesium/cobalt transporter CorA [Chloroflexi bacterium]|nr:magnesium/cobalt transporter CorA [Chloroflexota bacterium]
MPRLVKARSKKTGLPPGALVHIGERRAEKTRITLLEYDDAQVEEREIKDFRECPKLEGKPTVTWINVIGLHDVELLQKMGDCFGLHPLVLEDILNTDQRPKLEDYEDYLYIVLKMLHADDRTSEQVSLVLGPNFVLSFQETEGDVFEPVKERLKSGKGRIRKFGADYLAYALLDCIVDRYFGVLEKLSEGIELLEEQLVATPTRATLRAIHSLKVEMILLTRSVWPLREVISSLQRGESPLIKEPTTLYLRDVYDHTIHVMDTIETSRDIVTGMLDIYLSSVSNRLNEVMKVLTIIATIFMPLTFIVGVYGMNFEKLWPDVAEPWAFWLVMLAMAGIGLAMLAYFKKRKWL